MFSRRMNCVEMDWRSEVSILKYKFLHMFLQKTQFHHTKVSVSIVYGETGR